MIRQATPADGQKLFYMACRFMAETHYGALFKTNTTALEHLVAIVLEKGIVFVAEVDHANDCASWFNAMDGGHFPPAGQQLCNCPGGIVGMIGLVVGINLLTGKPYADEIAWWVNPEHRASTIGHRLLRSAEDWARQKGLSVLKMVAPAGSKIGMLYERAGYVAVETAFQKSLTD